MNRIINIGSLNTQGGLHYEKLFPFIEKMGAKLDIIGLQEVYNADLSKSEQPPFDGIRYLSAFQKYCELLPDFYGYFHSARDGYLWKEPVPFPIGYGIALFVRKNIPHYEPTEHFVYGEKNKSITLGSDANYDRNLQRLKLIGNNRNIQIGHLHGVHVPKTWKNDCREREEQSEKICQLFKKDKNIILMGDFNLRPKARSFRKILNDLRLVDTISHAGIKSTRAVNLYSRAHEPGNTLLADYFLVSKNLLSEKCFGATTVRTEEVSDHLMIQSTVCL